MISVYFKVTVRDPWNSDEFVSYWVKTVKLSTHKFFEAQISRYSYYWFNVQANLSWRGSDHAGPGMEVTVAGYTISMRLYDSRHWNYETNDWQVYDAEECLPNE